MKRLLNYIGSRHFAIYILVLTTAVILFTNLLPNLSVMDIKEVEKLKSERPVIYALTLKLGVSKITKSPYFRAIPLFLFLSITLCTVKRIRAELKAGRKRGIIPENQTIKHEIILQPGEAVRDSIISLLRGKGWKLESIDAAGGAIVARKGKGGFWGSVLFHLGMNLALIGILLSIITGVWATISLTEGFPVEMPGALQGVSDKTFTGFPLRELMLESFEPSFEDDRFHVDYAVHLVGLDEFRIKNSYVTKVNEPLNLSGYNFVFNRGGYAPRFILKSDSGEVIVDAVVNMRISMPGEVDYISLPDEGLTISTELFPDFYEEDGVPKTRSAVPNNPVLFVEMKRWDEVIGRGFLNKDKEVSFDRYKMEFRELRHWVELVVSKDMGVPVILSAFFVLVAGLIVRFILNERLIWVIMRSTGKGLELGIGGGSGYFPAIFEEELKMVAEDIAGLDEGKAGETKL